MKKGLTLPAIAIATLLLPTQGLTASKGATGDIGIGFQASWPTGGLSAKKELNEKWTAQGVLGLFGTFNHYGVRGLYTLKRKPKFKTYAFGGVGMYSYDYTLDTETVFGASGGVGLEYDLSKNLDGLPLTVGAELGLGLVSFDHYNYGALSFGSSIHYWLD